MSSISNLPFKPNIRFTHSVLLDVPLDSAFKILATNEGFARVSKLSGICSGIKAIRSDTTTIPAGTSLAETSVIDLPLRTVEAGSQSSVQAQVQVNRHWYEKGEIIPLLFGLVRHNIKIQVCISYIDSGTTSSPISGGTPVYSLYEDVTEGSGIKIWTSRKFEEEEVVSEDGDKKGARIRVTEDCHVWAPLLLRSVTERIGREAHRAHMEAYHTMFE